MDNQRLMGVSESEEGYQKSRRKSKYTKIFRGSAFAKFDFQTNVVNLYIFTIDLKSRRAFFASKDYLLLYRRMLFYINNPFDGSGHRAGEAILSRTALVGS
jgi:hypothetical protein